MRSNAALAYARSSTARTLYTSAVTTGSGSITAVALARLLGPLGRGQLAAALIWPTLLAYIFSVGHPSAAIYYLGRSEEGRDEYFPALLVACVWQSLVAIALGYLLLPIVLASQASQVVTLARWSLLLIPAMLLTLYCAAALQAVQDFAAFNLLRAFVPCAYLLLVIILATGHRETVPRVLFSFVTLNMLSCALGLSFVLRNPSVRIGKVTRRATVDLVRYGLRAGVGDISALANYRLDTALIAAFLSATSVGIYVAAVSFSQALLIVSVGIRTVSQPRLTASIDSYGIRRVLQEAFNRYTALALPILLLSIAATPLAVHVLFGGRFGAAIVPAQITLVATYSFGVKEMCAMVAQATGDPWLASKYDLFGVVLTLITLPPLLFLYGLGGAAAATLISYTGQALLFSLRVRRLHGVRITPYLIRAPKAPTAIGVGV